MKIEIERVELKELDSLREMYRHEANCQLVHYSLLGRGAADPYLARIEGRVAGYGSVENRYTPGSVNEFYILPPARPYALPVFREFLAASAATDLEAQTNLPTMLTLLYDCATDIRQGAILFADSAVTSLPPPPGARFRAAVEADAANGEWVIDLDGAVVASGAALYHYNPPYGDIYMGVEEAHRRRGYGSYLVQEIKRVTYERGKRPAARCNPTNLASRRTLERAGFLPCARMLVGKVAVSEP